MHRIIYIHRYLFIAVVAVTGFLTMPVWGQTINESHKLLASDGASSDRLGGAVAMSGDTIIATQRPDINNAELGAAFIYTQVDGLWSQQAKLIPGDGIGSQQFGASVAISGDIAVVGSYRDNDNGSQSGSAYVYARTLGVWSQSAKLLASDGDVNDQFGTSVSISGETIVVGALNESGTGSAYIFTRVGGVWIEQTKLLPDSDGAFGLSACIENDTVIIGATSDSTNGTWSGAAYVFVRTGGTWSQQAKLLPLDGAELDQFGRSVSLSGDSALVGAYGDDDNGADSGSAYVFTRTGSAWIQQGKLVPSGSEAGDQIGNTVSLSGDTAILGARGDDDNGQTAGAGYAFTRVDGSWSQQAKILTSDGAAFDLLSYELGSVAFIGDIAVFGATGDDDNGSSSGSVYVFQVVVGVDSDGDGLLDDWETNGIPYTDNNGIEQRYMLPDADPNYKDLYVEVDAMEGFELSAAASVDVDFAFSNSPLDNPNGSNGINLHILRDETDLPHVAVWNTDGCWPLDFDSWRSTSYGTFDERANVNHAAILEAKAKAYRYCIVGDTADDPDTKEVEAIGGCGELYGVNSVVFFGANGGGMVSDDVQAAIFMHELGHNLGLSHGGGDDINGKPNYPSIMNYAMEFKYAWNEDFWTLDFSRADAASLETLDESSLDETVSVGSKNSYYSEYFMPFGVNVDNNGATERAVRYIALDGSTSDFGDTEGTMFQDDERTQNVAQDLNYSVITPPGIRLPGVASPGETLEPYNDWGSISLGLSGDGTNLRGVIFPTDELTHEARDWIDQNYPVPPAPCPADLNGDGVLDFFDVSAFLVAFGQQDPTADFTADGVFDFFDVSAFLQAFSLGCS